MGRRPKKWIDQEPVRSIAFGVGVVIVLASPIIGAIPGPGGTIVFAFGLALMLRTSRWAKHKYVLLKRRYPGIGRWTDWGLRRRSELRRRRAAKQEKQDNKAINLVEDVD